MVIEISYEWDVETVDEHGDIIDHQHSDTLEDLLPLEENQELVLVRDRYVGHDLVSRQWAYVSDGELPEYFSYSDGNHGTKVPQKFHREL